MFYVEKLYKFQIDIFAQAPQAFAHSSHLLPSPSMAPHTQYTINEPEFDCLVDDCDGRKYVMTHDHFES